MTVAQGGPLYCIAKGANVFMKEGTTWRRFKPTHKALCGRLVDVTGIKMGDVRQILDVGVVRVKGHNIAAPVRSLRRVGGGS